MVAKKKAAAPELPLDETKQEFTDGPQNSEGVGSEFQKQTEAAADQAAAESPHAPQPAPAEPPPKPKGGWGKKAAAPAPTGADDEAVNLSNIKKSLLASVERIERLMEERAGIGEDIKDEFAALRGQGYNTKIVREVLKRRGWGDAAIKEHDQLIDLYEEALK